MRSNIPYKSYSMLTDKQRKSICLLKRTGILQRILKYTSGRHLISKLIGVTNRGNPYDIVDLAFMWQTTSEGSAYWSFIYSVLEDFQAKRISFADLKKCLVHSDRELLRYR